MAISNRYRLIRMGKRCLISIPSRGWRVRSSAVMCYPAHTLKKAIFRRGLQVAVLCGIDAVLCRESDWPSDALRTFNFQGWLENIRQDLAQGPVVAAVVWPAQATRGRLYVHILDERCGKPIAFVKLSLDGFNDQKIGNEISMLREMQPLSLRRLRYPSLRSEGRWQGRLYGVFDPVPKEARLLNWERDAFPLESLNEYCGISEMIPPSDLERAAWHRRFLERKDDVPAFARDVLACSIEETEVCRVHGDLNRTNVFRCGENYWIVDWEQSCKQGPKLTDAICADVDRRWPKTKADPVRSLCAFAQMQFAEGDPQKFRNVVLGLAFLVAAGFPPATELTRHWDRLGELPSVRKAHSGLFRHSVSTEV